MQCPPHSVLSEPGSFLSVSAQATLLGPAVLRARVGHRALSTLENGSSSQRATLQLGSAMGSPDACPLGHFALPREKQCESLSLHKQVLQFISF